MIFEGTAISEKICADWISHFDEALDKGRVGDNQLDESTRRSNVRFFSRRHAAYDHKVFAVLQTIQDLTFDINAQLGVDLDEVLNFQFTKYDGNDLQTYDWHNDTDMFSGEIRPRKLSISIALNTQGLHYKGGEFGIKDALTHSFEEKEYQLQAGQFLAFPSFYWHKVKPVQEGTRYSIVSWFRGPRWK